MSTLGMVTADRRKQFLLYPSTLSIISSIFLSHPSISPLGSVSANRATVIFSTAALLRIFLAFLSFSAFFFSDKSPIFHHR